MLAWWQSLSIHDATLIEVCIALLAAVLASNLKRERRKPRMSIHDKNWKYAPHADTVKPGYLARKFARIRAEAAANRANAPKNVQPMKRKAA